MGLTIRSSYSNDRLPWLKGNLHAHTSNSDGPHSPQGVVDEYAARGYDFLMLSDHDFVTSPDGLDGRGMTLISGNEVTMNGPHLLHVGARSAVAPEICRQTVIDTIRKGGGLAILCHPNWEKHFNHCPQEQLEALRGYTGIEIHNGVVEWLEGSADATDRWDRLLGQGRRLWGFANDDCHKPTDIGIAWNVVQSAKRDPESIVQALHNGSFYASTGVTIDRISVEDHTIRVETRDADRISVYSDFGYRRGFADAASIVFSAPADAPYTYVRFECAGRGEARAWTQPFYLEKD